MARKYQSAGQVASNQTALMMHIMNEERVTLSKSAMFKAFERGERLLKNRPTKTA